MTLFSLEPRLALCASMVRPGTRLADVGTDHAYLPVWLARKGLISGAVASDVRPGPLARAEKNIKKYDVENMVRARLSDGLDAVLPGEADDIVAAGMGGLLIAEIICRAEWLKSGEKHLILQPMTREDDLRRSLSEHGFAVCKEQAVQEENHLYTAMLCVYDPAHCAKGELFPYIGGLTPETPENRAYLHREAERLRKKANGLRLEGHCEDSEHLFQIREQILALFPQKPEE